MSTVEEIQHFELLQGLEPDELEHLAERLISRKAKKGSHIIQANEEGHNIVFIGEGEVRITVIASEGKEVIITQFGKGEVFGELALLTNSERNADCVALEDCTLHFLSQEDFERHILQHSGLTRTLLKTLAERLQASSIRILELSVLDVYHRVWRTLERLSSKHPDGRMTIEKRPTHQELASMTGTSREMVTRAFKKLEDDEKIEVDGKRVIMLDMTMSSESSE